MALPEETADFPLEHCVAMPPRDGWSRWRLRFAARRAGRGVGFVWLAAVLAAAVLVLLLAIIWLSLTTGVPAIPGGPY
jgi:hypothetical protein